MRNSKQQYTRNSRHAKQHRSASPKRKQRSTHYPQGQRRPTWSTLYTWGQRRPTWRAYNIIQTNSWRNEHDKYATPPRNWKWNARCSKPHRHYKYNSREQDQQVGNNASHGYNLQPMPMKCYERLKLMQVVQPSTCTGNEKPHLHLLMTPMSMKTGIKKIEKKQGGVKRFVTIAW